MTDWYIPKVVYQLDGSDCQGSNCWASSGCVMLDGATSGGAVLTPTSFRQRAGGGSGSGSKGCASGFEADIVAGLKKMGIVEATLIKISRPEAKRRLAKERAAMFSVATDYELWPSDMKGSAPDFDGNHMVVALPGANSKGKVSVANPLVKDWQNIHLDVLLDAAEKFSRDHARAGAIWLVRVYRKAVPGPAPSDSVIDGLRRQNEILRDALDDAHDDAALIAASLGKFNRPT